MIWFSDMSPSFLSLAKSNSDLCSFPIDTQSPKIKPAMRRDGSGDHFRGQFPVLQAHPFLLITNIRLLMGS